MKNPTNHATANRPRIAPPLSQSRRGDMACETLYVHKHIQGGAVAESEAAARGTEIHRVLATYINHLVATRRASDLVVFDDLAKAPDTEACEVLEKFRDNHTFDPEKIALKALGHMEKPDVPSDLPSAQEVGKKLEDLRRQKERLIAQKAKGDTCWQNAQARLKQVQVEIEEASTEVLSPSELQELLQLESPRGHVEELQQELTELTAEQRTVERALAAAQGLKDKCTTCGKPISSAEKAKEVGTLSWRLSEIEGLIQDAREELNEFSDLEVATSRVESHRRALARRAIVPLTDFRQGGATGKNS